MLLDELVSLLPVVQAKLELLLINVAFAKVGAVFGKAIEITILNLLFDELLCALHESLCLGRSIRARWLFLFWLLGGLFFLWGLFS